MKYVCLVYLKEHELLALPRQELEAIGEESMAYDEELARRGHLIAAEALQSVQTATLVRVRGGRVSVTDGPFAETNEQLGGFILIEAADLNEAIQVAAGIPLARTGSVEVRPVMTMGGE